MRRSTFLPLTFAAVMTLASVACDSGTDTPTTPTTPGPTVTETFAGSVTLNGAATFTFNTNLAGIVNATLRTIAPVDTTQIGLAIGTWNGVTCAVVLANDRITAGMAVTGQVNGAGGLCVRVYDVGQLTVTSTFEIVVVHP